MLITCGSAFAVKLHELKPRSISEDGHQFHSFLFSFGSLCWNPIGTISPFLNKGVWDPPYYYNQERTFLRPEAQELRQWSLSCVNAYLSHLFTRSDIPYTLLVFMQANPFLHETLLSWKASSFTRSCGKAVVGLASRSWEGMNLMSFCRSRAWSWMVLPHWTARWKQVEKPCGPRISCATQPPNERK